MQQEVWDIRGVNGNDLLVWSNRQGGSILGWEVWEVWLSQRTCGNCWG